MLRLPVGLRRRRWEAHLTQARSAAPAKARVTSSPPMPYSTAEARQQLLDDIAVATEDIGVALAVLTEAYAHLEEGMAARMEEELFRPVQVAYGRARRTHTGFAERHGLPTRAFEPRAH